MIEAFICIAFPTELYLLMLSNFWPNMPRICLTCVSHRLVWKPLCVDILQRTVNKFYWLMNETSRILSYERYPECCKRQSEGWSSNGYNCDYGYDIFCFSLDFINEVLKYFISTKEINIQRVEMIKLTTKN